MKFFTKCLPSLLHRLLVLGVDGLNVLPDQTLGVLEVVAALPEDVGGVEGSHRLDPLDLVPLAAVLGDPEVLVYYGLGSGAAEAEDDLRLYGPYLSLQVRVAGPDLTRPRLAVLHPPTLLDRGPALDDVGEVDLLTGKVHRCEDVVEELACPPYEREPRSIFVLARPLPYQHQRRVRVAASEDRVRPAQGQITPGAHRDLASELFEPLFPALAALSGVEQTVHSFPPWSSSCQRSCVVPFYPRPPPPGHHRQGLT